MAGKQEAVVILKPLIRPLAFACIQCEKFSKISCTSA